MNDTCSGYTAVHKLIDEEGSNYKNIIIIAFRGTTNVDQLFEEGWDYKEMVPFIAGGTVSKYFFNAFNDIWIKGGMRDDVLTLKNKYTTDYEGPDFYVVGHSLGKPFLSFAHKSR